VGAAVFGAATTAGAGFVAGAAFGTWAMAAGAGGSAVAGAGGSGTTYGASSAWCGVKQTLDTRCVVCHADTPLAGAPMPLTTYADTQAPAFTKPSSKVYELMELRVHDSANPMPPQQALTAEQLAGIDAWVAAGAPAGDDPTCGGVTSMPPVMDSWPDHCDATYKIVSHGSGGDSQPYIVPAGQELHPNVSVAAPWGSEAVQGIAFRPITDNTKVLHHWILYGSKREFLVGWAPGKDTTPLPADVGMNLSGGTLTLNMHYNNLLGTSDEQDQSGVEICVLQKPNFRANTAAVHTGFSKLAFNIPAHATGVNITGSCTVTATTPVTIITASPHAHKLATHMKFTVQKASGETIVMHDADFDFNEQQAYAMNPAVQLVTGDKVFTTCTYTNDTDQAVHFGENTEDEMCFNFAAYYPMGALSCGYAFDGGGL
jgi:hypothetical protein